MSYTSHHLITISDLQRFSNWVVPILFSYKIRSIKNKISMFLLRLRNIISRALSVQEFTRTTNNNIQKKRLQVTWEPTAYWSSNKYINRNDCCRPDSRREKLVRSVSFLTPASYLIGWYKLKVRAWK